jgi:hypothetical protein
MVNLNEFPLSLLGNSLPARGLEERGAARALLQGLVYDVRLAAAQHNSIHERQRCLF